MKLSIRKCILMVASLMLLPLVSLAQTPTITAGPANVSLSMTVSESLTITATPASITFTPSGTTATASGPITVTTSYNLAAGHTMLEVIAYLSSQWALQGAANISAADLLWSDNGGAAAPCNTQASGFAWSPAGSVELCGNPYIDHLGLSTAVNGSLSDSVVLSLTGLPSPLPAGSYAGTISFEAVVI